MKHKKKDINVLSRAFKTEVVFSEKDSLILDGQSKICNWLYNNLLQLSIDDYKYSGNTLKLTSGYNARNYMVNNLKLKYNFINTLFSSVSKNACLRLTESYEKFFNQKDVGFPKFKSWKKNWFSLKYDEIESKGIKIKDRKITITLGKNEEGNKLKINGLLKNKIPYKGNFKLKTLVLTKKQNKYYVSIQVDFEKKREITTDKKRWIVIDPNHKNFFVALDYNNVSYEFSNADCFKYFDEEIDFVKSKLDKCKKEKVKKIYDSNGKYVETKVEKGSKKRKRLEKVLFNLYHVRQEQIKKLCYSIGHWLCKEYDFIGIGDYVPSLNTAKYDNMHRSMLNQTYIGLLRSIVQKVTIKSYKNYKKLDERNSTKRCSFCFDHEKHEPNIRIFTCKKCNKTIYRDINSCINFAINENFILSGTDLVDLDVSKPTYTFNLNHKVDSICNMIVKERLIKEKT